MLNLVLLYSINLSSRVEDYDSPLEVFDTYGKQTIDTLMEIISCV